MRATPKDHRNSPTYWFAILEIARSRGDVRLASDARAKLLRLGVAVEFVKSNRGPVTHA
jgi:hypothetical protein